MSLRRGLLFATSLLVASVVTSFVAESDPVILVRALGVCLVAGAVLSKVKEMQMPMGGGWLQDAADGVFMLLYTTGVLLALASLRW